MSLQLSKRTQRNISCAVLALPLALANLSGVHAATATVVKSTTTAAGTTTSYAATVITATTTTAGKTSTSTPANTTTGTTTTGTSTSILPTIKNTAAAAPVLAYSNTTAFGNFLRPFAANSMWNARPVNPVFGTFVIPTSSYYPAIGAGAFSTGVFEGLATDPAVVVSGLPNSKGVWDPDSETYVPSVTIPHWPAATTPATGGDGHADIVDTTTGIVHSFWQLKKVDGKWVAATYAWTRIDGSGWGNPTHYYQGARAAAVPPIGGLIRKHELNDGAPTYKHALAMSLTFNGLSPKPAYVFPATSADTNAASLNSGGIPEGALVMLPPSFDENTITNLALRKIVATLKVYGAYVVDQNVGTPFYIYVENGAGFDLHNGGWSQPVANDLQRIRAALRMVTSTSSWLDGNGKTMVPNVTNHNLLSMRGPWVRQSGNVTGKFNSLTQQVEFPATTTASTMINGSTRGLAGVTWVRAAAGDTVRLSVTATGGAKMRIQVWTGTKVFLDTGNLGNGQSARWTIPAGAWYSFYTVSGNSGTESTVKGVFEKVAP